VLQRCLDVPRELRKRSFDKPPPVERRASAGGRTGNILAPKKLWENHFQEIVWRHGIPYTDDDDSRTARFDGVAYMTTPPKTPSKTVVYIDGFNLYYGALSQTSFRWLDLDKLVQLLMPHDKIVKVKYFTALVKGPSRVNQEAYLNAISSRPRIEVVMGNFKRKTVECGNPTCPGQPRSRRRFETHEEKRTDVNIALHMLDDLYQARCERFVLVSGDSDLVPAIELVFMRLPNAKVNVYIPVPANKAGARERSYKKELRTVSTTVRALPSQLLLLSLFPDPVVCADGTKVIMPAAWSSPKSPRPFTFAPAAAGQCGWCGKA
jgi:uncharacterized LabA/DUF88 family protein